MVLANKSDLPNAASADKVSQALDLPALTSHTWQIFHCSALKGTGVKEAMEWLVNSLKHR